MPKKIKIKGSKNLHVAGRDIHIHKEIEKNEECSLPLNLNKTLERPFFVVESCEIVEDEDYYFPYFGNVPRTKELIYITLRNVGADISWLEVHSPERVVTSLNSTPMPHGANTLLRLDYDRVNALRDAKSPIILVFEYVTKEGFCGTQTYNYSRGKFKFIS